MRFNRHGLALAALKASQSLALTASQAAWQLARMHRRCDAFTHAPLICSMRLRLLPMRFSAELPSDREHDAAHEPQGGPSLKSPAAANPAKQSNSTPSTSSISEPAPSPIPAVKPLQENAPPPQPSGQNGVRKDMATLAIGNPGLDSAQREGRNPVRAAYPAEVDGAPEGVSAKAQTERTDAEIMLAVAAGDEVGYNYLVGKYHRQIIHFLFRMCRNEAIAEELAQEVFLRVYRSRESYRAEAKFSTWLYRIATNLAVNHARDTKHERTAQTVNLDEPDSETGSTPEVADADPNIEQRMLREERMAAIRAEVAALPERQRLAVLMHKYQEMDYRQIGEVLKLSESATKSLLFRAYQTLRERLKNFV